METEDELRRPPPPCPYQAGPARLYLPDNALAGTLALLQRARRLESGVYWYGTKTKEGDGQVKLVVAPLQYMSWSNFVVSTQALTAIVSRLPDDWKPLAQVHSHPGARVEHSNYDDRMASSKRALSVVFPHYGHCRVSFPGDVGVHEYQNNYWHLLDTEAARRRITVTTAADVQVEDHRQ